MPSAPAISPAIGSQRAEPNHIPALDGLRGLAVLLVMGFHFIGIASVSERNVPLMWIHKALSGGWVGVDIFFVLSGFLITGILYDSLQAERYFRNFYGRRFLRIFPLYYGYLFVAFLLSKRLHLHWGTQGWYLLTYTQNFVLSPQDRVGNLTSHFWSLAIEEQFYLIWPITMFAIRDRRRLMQVAVAVSAAAFLLRVAMLSNGVSAMLNYQFTLCRCDSLLIGAWLALFLRGGGTIYRVSRPALLICSAILASFAFMHGDLYFWRGWFIGTFGYLLVAIWSAALLLLALEEKSLVHSIFTMSCLRWFGAYSYGIYVYHMGVLMLINTVVLRSVTLSTRLRLLHILVPAISSVSLITTCALAWLSYNLYEVRFLKLKRYFSYARPPHQPVMETQQTL